MLTIEKVPLEDASAQKSGSETATTASVGEALKNIFKCKEWKEQKEI